MKHCSYCGKELKDTQAWCPHCMRRQLEAKAFENAPVERDAKHARALRVIPCCLTAAAAVILAAVLVPAAFRPSPPVEAVVLPSESGAPVVLTEPEITSDPVIATEPTEVPSAVEPLLPPFPEQNGDNDTFREVDMNFFAQEVIKYLQQKYPNNLIPAEKFPRMEMEYAVIPKNTIPADDWQSYLEHTIFSNFFRGKYFSARYYLSMLGTACVDSSVDYAQIPSDPNQDISQFFPGSTRPHNVCEFTIEYVGLSDDGQEHLFEVYTFLHRPTLIEENFDSVEFLELVKQLLPEYNWVDSFTREEFSLIETIYSISHVNDEIIYDHLLEHGVNTELTARYIAQQISIDPNEFDYYDVYLVRDEQVYPNALEVMVKFYVK